MGFLIPLLIVLAIDFYTFQGLKTLISSSVQHVNYIYLSYWVISIMLPALFIYGMMEMRRNHQMPAAWVTLGNIWFILLVTKLVFILVLFGEDIYRFFEAIYFKVSSYFSDEITVESPSMASRRKFVSQGALLLASIPFMSLTYGMIRGRYQYKIHKQTIYYKDLPEEFDGFRICQISDIHSGSFDDRDGVLKGLDMIKSLNADLIVFTGDLVNTFASEFDPWVADFKTLKAPYGQFSILGNHDYGEYTQWETEEAKQQNFEAVKAHHAKIDFKLLLDESVKIEKNGQSLRLLGVENWGVGFGKRGNLEKALHQVNASDFKILLSHDPTHWENEVKMHPQHIHLTLSGHTHGMQMGIEIPGFKWSPIQYRYPKWAGQYEEAGRNLYINRGFGVLGFRGRVGIWPEITEITLKKGELSL
ncbi:MAG TPA: metallophosphoesterase [Saprospiraceae bacterium]|nr:metallophosphoesterase [Saprospiraceae bacterium]